MKKIKGTYASCTITDITVVDTTAIVSLVIASNETEQQDKVFNFYIKDENEVSILSSANYWINKSNIYTNSNINIDIGTYKEIKLKIDITKNFTSKIKDLKWIRKCKIVIVNITDFVNETVWESEELQLLSQTISVPSIHNFEANFKKNSANSEEGKIKLTWNYEYDSLEDTSYELNNVITLINVYSDSTNNLLESYELANQTNVISTSLSMNYSDFPVIIQINILSESRELLKKESYYYNPEEVVAKAFIKTADGIKPSYSINTLGVKKETLNMLLNEEKDIIYTGINFNNLNIKLPNTNSVKFDIAYCKSQEDRYFRHCIYIDVCLNNEKDKYDSLEIELYSEYQGEKLLHLTNLKLTTKILLDDLLNEYIDYPQSSDTILYENQLRNYEAFLDSDKYRGTRVTIIATAHFSKYSKTYTSTKYLPRYLTPSEYLKPVELLFVSTTNNS